MTIAITGNWGEGKSSLMNLVQADLKKHGTRSVWFNAWHHQKEQHLFAALLQAVRDQAIPSAWTLRGLGFRWHLFKSRAYRHWGWMIVSLVLAGLSVGMLWTNPTPMSPAGLEEWKDWDHTAPFIPFILSLFIAYQGCVATLKRSGVNPGQLLATASRAFGVKTFGDQLGFRHRFGEAFQEVVEALRPNTLLILIDDLDRCRPEQVVEVLEAINFLVSAGPCYVVMGIAPEQVMYCVGLGFKEIAAEMAEAPADHRDPEIWAREKRRDFARNYLEKLINIEVPIPRLTDEDAGKIAEPVRSNGGSSEFRTALRYFVRRLAIFVGMIAILGTGIYAGTGTYQNPTTTPGQRPSTDQLSSTSTSEPSLTTPPDGEQAPQSPEPSGDGNGTLRPGADDRVPWWLPLLAGVLALAELAAIAMYMWRQGENRIQDSLAFTKALSIWHPLVRARTNSPRQMKRFMNRVRYLAMASPAAPDVSAQRPSESLIVALAALQGISRNVAAGNEEQSLPLNLAHLFVTSPRDADHDATVINDWLDKTLEEQEQNRIQETIRHAFDNHRYAFPGENVTQEILSQFDKMASGIVVR